MVDYRYLGRSALKVSPLSLGTMMFGQLTPDDEAFRIIDKAREKNPAIKVVIAGMQMPDNMGAEFTGKFKDVFPKVAEAKKAALVPFLLDSVGGVDALNQKDRIHPTAEGQVKVAENVWKVLETQL